MFPPIPRLEDYDISPEHGFLPSEIPLEVLPDHYYAPWETVIRNLQGLILSRRLHGVVDKLPVLSTDYLLTEAEWRRAYSILAIISHAYIWGGDTPCDTVPPPISIPFTSTCNHFELPTVATYAGLTLWNWRPLFSNEPIDNLENLSTLFTLTGSLDESWFYLVSVAIEARAAPIIPLMLEAVAAARRNDSITVTECLRAFAERLDELGGLLQRMYENCDAHVFYHRIRPFLAGSKNMADAGLPNGVIFDDGTGTQPYVQYSGGSNAQSSVIQFFDIILGVEHRPTGQSAPDGNGNAANGSENAAGVDAVQSPTHNFITEMRRYMPGPHRRFLEAVASVANIREFVSRRKKRDGALTTAFDACLAMLRAFRDKHIQMVSRYIIVKSRESRSHSRSMSPRQQAPRVNLASGSKAARAGRGSASNGGGASGGGPVRHGSSGADDDEQQRRRLRGTGGTALIPFLKQARDETGEPAIDAWARRLLTNGPADASVGARLTKVGEHASGEMEIVGLAGTWSVDDSEGGICHW